MFKTTINDTTIKCIYIHKRNDFLCSWLTEQSHRSIELKDRSTGIVMKRLRPALALTAKGAAM